MAHVPSGSRARCVCWLTKLFHCVISLCVTVSKSKIIISFARSGQELEVGKSDASLKSGLEDRIRIGKTFEELAF